MLRWDGIPGQAEEVGEAVYGEVYASGEETGDPEETDTDLEPETVEDPNSGIPERIGNSVYASGFCFLRSGAPSTEILLAADPAGGVEATLHRRGSTISFSLLGTEGPRWKGPEKRKWCSPSTGPCG